MGNDFFVKALKSERKDVIVTVTVPDDEKDEQNTSALGSKEEQVKEPLLDKELAV